MKNRTVESNRLLAYVCFKVYDEIVLER